MNYRKTSKQPLPPLLHFRKVMLQIVFNFILKKPRLEAKNRQYKFWQFYGNSSFLEVPPDTRPKERRGRKDNEDTRPMKVFRVRPKCLILATFQKCHLRGDLKICCNSEKKLIGFLAPNFLVLPIYI